MDASADLLSAVLGDLAGEDAWLDAVLAGLDDPGWRRPTPAPGWTVAHQIAHLTWTDEMALCAATDPAAFASLLPPMLTGEVTVDSAAAAGAALAPPDLLARWRSGQAELATALSAMPAGSRLPWFGPPMSAASMATARLMETWAHGNDVADALGVPHPVLNGLRHIAFLAVRTRDFAFALHGLTPPAEPFFVQLTGPDGAVWTWGPADAAQSVEGSALDLCLVAAQRRHRLDTDLVATGADADHWLDIAQAFAGPPGAGREPTGRPGAGREAAEAAGAGREAAGPHGADREATEADAAEPA